MRIEDAHEPFGPAPAPPDAGGSGALGHKRRSPLRERDRDRGPSQYADDDPSPTAEQTPAIMVTSESNTSELLDAAGLSVSRLLCRY